MRTSTTAPGIPGGTEYWLPRNETSPLGGHGAGVSQLGWMRRRKRCARVSAVYSEAVLNTAVKFDVRFSVTAGQDKRIRAAIEAIEE